MSYSGSVKDENGNEFSVSISLSPVVKEENVVEPAAMETAESSPEPGTVEAQEKPAES